MQVLQHKLGGDATPTISPKPRHIHRTAGQLQYGIKKINRDKDG